MENIRANPVNWMFNHTEQEGETLREIAFQIINFIDHELMKLDFDKLKYAAIKLRNQFGKTAYHKLTLDSLKTL